MGNAELTVVAHRQHGPFTRHQALDAGFTPCAVRQNIASSRWLVLHPGVFCEAGVAPSLKRDASGAVLAAGADAAASHRTAGTLWELDVPLLELPEVAVTSRVRLHSVAVHLTQRLGRSEAAVRDGIRMTSPMRTLLDLAEVLDCDLLEQALDRLWRRRLVDPRRFATYLDDDWCRRRRGTATLRRLVGERAGDRPSGSDVETLLLQIIREATLPAPARQYPVVTPFGIRYLDLAYPEPKIAIEVDGMESRMDPKVFLDERDRQNLIEAQGWTFRRFGYKHVTSERFWTVCTIAEALALEPVRWTRRR